MGLLKSEAYMGGLWDGGIMWKAGGMPIIGPCPIGPMGMGMGGLRGGLFRPEGGRRGGSGAGLLLGLAAIHPPSCSTH